MIVTLQTERVRTLDQVRAFVEGSKAVDFTGADRESVYEFVRRALVRLDYAGLGKSDKGLVRRYLAKVTGLSRAQLTRLIGQHRETGRIKDRRGGAPAHPFERRYTRADIRLLAAVDAAMGQMSGPATRALMRRQYEVFGDERFERLAGLSNGHLYNLRRSATYQRRRTVVAKTRATHNAIGQRRKPRPDGQPGYVRVDTVHQGDQDGAKGVYHVNMVDDVTQFQFVGTVQAISERFLLPVLEGLIEAFPFVIQGIHADNASRRDAPARSTSTTASPPPADSLPGQACSTSCASGSSPNHAPATATTTPSPRATTPAWCASTSATATSRAASPPRSTSSHSTCSRPSSTTTAPACSPPTPSTPRAASPSATTTAT